MIEKLQNKIFKFNSDYRQYSEGLIEEALKGCEPSVHVKVYNALLLMEQRLINELKDAN